MSIKLKGSVQKKMMDLSIKDLTHPPKMPNKCQNKASQTSL